MTKDKCPQGGTIIILFFSMGVAKSGVYEDINSQWHRSHAARLHVLHSFYTSIRFESYKLVKMKQLSLVIYLLNLEKGTRN